MNAPTTAPEIAELNVELIPVTNIAPSETHIQQLRRKRYDMETLANLTASVVKLGVQQPGIVRKLPALRGLAAYELVAGERRWRASRQAGLAHFPAIIRVLTDAEVLEIQLVENLQRETLHPLEEAAGYEELMKVGKITADQVGEKVGLSRSWVYSRLNLLKLPKEAQDALQTGGIDVSRALIVASVADPDRRSLVLEKARERNHDNNFRYSVRQLRAEIVKERQTFPLRGAPFPTGDATLLPKAGDCGGCQYRTGNCDPEALDPDVCTNVPCYELKVKAHAERRRQEAKAKGIKILKGEEARMLSPSVKTVYGHVDLDLVCEHDDFPEPEPKGVDYDNSSHPAMVAWRAKEESWQPRTYRALLTGQKFGSVLIEDPKTKELRELVPFKSAQQLLKKLGVDLPSYANRTRPSFSRAGAGSRSSGPEDSAKAQAKREAEGKKRQEEEAIETAIAARLVEQLKAKADGVVGVEELIYLAQLAFQDDMPEAVSVPLLKLYGLKDPGWDWDKALEKLSSKDLPRFIVTALAAMSLVDSYGRLEKLGDKICARLKVDPKKIEQQVRAEFKKRTEAVEAPAAAKPKRK